MSGEPQPADESTSSGIRSLCELFDEADHRAAERLCRRMTVTSSDVFTFALAGWVKRLGSYECRMHNVDHVPADLQLTTKDKATIEGSRLGMAPRASITALQRKLKSVFATRRVFKAFLFLLPGTERWHLIYFDQRDQAGEENHWIEGPHIHYVRETHTRLSPDEVWAQVCATPPKPPRGEHIRCSDPP